MANPQKEEGHIRIANEIWDAVGMFKITKNQRAALWLIWRMSYGCGQKACRFREWRDFSECADIKEGHIKKVLGSLVDAKVLFIDREQKAIAFNKNYETWKLRPARFDKTRYSDLVKYNLSSKKTIGKITKHFFDNPDSRPPEKAIDKTSRPPKRGIQNARKGNCGRPKGASRMPEKAIEKSIDSDYDKPEVPPKNRKDSKDNKKEKKFVFVNGNFVDQKQKDDYSDLSHCYGLSKSAAQNIIQQCPRPELHRICEKYDKWKEDQKAKGFEEDLPGTLINFFAEAGVEGIKREA